MNLPTKIKAWRKLLPALAFLCIAAVLTLAGCISVTPSANPAVTPQPSEQPQTKKPESTLTPAPTPTPVPTQEPSLPSIEAFIADPSYNPGGQKLAGLADAKIAVDTAWQLRYGQTYSYYQTSPSLSDQYKPWGISQLQKVLDEFKKTPWVSLYNSDFCCRHMSTLLQRELTIRGFESWIVIGKDPKVPSGHAWVVVFVRSPNIQLVPVEATALEIPQPGKTYLFSNGVTQTYEDYSHQGWVLQDIYQAQAWARGWWGLNDFGWWDKTDILKKLGLPTLITTPTPPPVPTPKPAQYVLSTSVSPIGGGTVSPGSGTYDSGAIITLTATPSSGYRFSSWSGNANGTSPTITITMDTNKNVAAIFTSIPNPSPTPTPAPVPTPTPTPTPTPVPAPILQHIETPMQGVPIFSISYMNYTKYLQAGDIIDGVVQLTGLSNAVDNSYQWQFQILGPGGESIKVLTGDFRTTTSMSFHTVASYAGTYRIRITHQSISTRNLIIDLTPPGWGYANLG